LKVSFTLALSVNEGITIKLSQAKMTTLPRKLTCTDPAHFYADI